MGLPNVSESHVAETCLTCGISFWVPLDWQKLRVKNQKFFYCPNGHQQRYCGKTEEEELRQENERLQSKAERLRDTLNATERSRAAQKGHLTRIKNRIANGVCPCCNRQFPNLRDHMDTKHPEWTE